MSQPFRRGLRGIRQCSQHTAISVSSPIRALKPMTTSSSCRTFSSRTCVDSGRSLNSSAQTRQSSSLPNVDRPSMLSSKSTFLSVVNTPRSLRIVSYALHSIPGARRQCKSLSRRWRRSDVDVASVQRLLFDRGSKVDLQTYDDVATRLEFYRAQLFARNENNPGLSIHIVAVLGKQPAGDNYILDYGLEADRNRVSIYVSPDDTLRFRVIDQAGVAHSTSVNMDMANVLYDVPVYLVFELGFAEEYTFTCIEVNGEYYADRRLDQVVLDSESLDWQVMGSDVLGKKLTEFSMIELAVYSRSLAFTEKLRLRGYFFQRYYHCMDGSGVLPARVSFSGNQFLYSSGHPNFLEGGQ